MNRSSLRVPALLVVAVVHTFIAAARGALYSTDFESGAGPEWSVQTVEASATNAFTKFLGRFGNEAVRLTLDDLVPGAGYVVVFDLYLMDSWDGNGVAGPDYVSVTVDGQRVFDETFSNYNGDPPSQSQTYPEQPEGGRIHRGFNPAYVDAIYRRIRVPFTPQAATAAITFGGRNLEDLENESWGLDNVNVETLSCASAPTNLTSFWPAEANALDAQGTNHGTLRGDTTFATGLIGQAFRFDGSGDYVEVPDSPSLNFAPNDPITVECWVYRTSPATVMHFLGKPRRVRRGFAGPDD